ncbi:kelch repeat-containing [Fusarium albosuccineum]|uniref:Kelch repeat-containing n=1 Tax=Fusarium albosuccineum TaxID=1237068 RepID=A0A8H4L5T8_9HYPO|nr:kelch repeat-containing [Fusarium albosuccineum]
MWLPSFQATLSLWLTVGTHLAVASGPGQGCKPTLESSWEELSPLAGGQRQEHAAVAVNNRIYVVGGLVPIGNPPTGVETVGRVEIYDVQTDTWDTAAPLPVPMNHPNLASANGKVYILGGLSGNINGSFLGLTDSFEYEPRTDNWTKLPSLPGGTGRGSSIMGVYKNEIIVAGGVQRIEQKFGGIQETVNTVSAFNFKTHTWRSLPSLPEGREHGGGTVIRDNFYVVGDLAWKNNRARMPTARGGISVAAVGNKIFAFGGEGNPDPTAGNVFNETEAYDIITDCWEELDPMPIPRHGFAAVTVGETIYTPGGGIRDFGVTDRLQAFRAR